MRDQPHDYELLNTLWKGGAPSYFQRMAREYQLLTGRPIKWTYIRSLCEAGWIGPISIPRYRRFKVDLEVIHPIIMDDPFLIMHNEAITKRYNEKAEIPVAIWSIRHFLRAHGISIARQSPHYEEEIEEAILRGPAQGWIIPPRSVEDEDEDIS